MDNGTGLRVVLELEIVLPEVSKNQLRFAAMLLLFDVEARPQLQSLIHLEQTNIFSVQHSLTSAIKYLVIANDPFA